MLPVETKKQKTMEGTGVAMEIQSEPGSDSQRRKEPNHNNEEGSKEMKKKPARKPARKKRNAIQPPISNLIQPYSVVTDIKKQKADITFGQLFQAVPKLRSELSKSLRTPQARRTKKAPQTEQLNADIRSTAMYCKASISGNTFPIIVDSGAAGSIVSKSLLDKLGLRIPRKSSVVIINVNGQKTSPLGEVDDLPLNIGGIDIPLSAVVTEANTYNAILGNDWLSKVGAQVNWKDSKLTFSWKGKEATVDVAHQYGEELSEEEEETDSSGYETSDVEELEVFVTEEETDSSGHEEPSIVKEEETDSSGYETSDVEELEVLMTEQHFRNVPLIKDKEEETENETNDDEDLCLQIIEAYNYTTEIERPLTTMKEEWHIF